MRTGQRECSHTLRVTLPSARSFERPLSPLLPITIRSAPSAFAALSITSAGSPTLCTNEACTPFFLHSATRSPSTFEAESPDHATSVALLRVRIDHSPSLGGGVAGRGGRGGRGGGREVRTGGGPSLCNRRSARPSA